MKKYLIIIIISFSFTASGQNVGIGTAMPNDKLDVNGNVRSTGLRIIDGNVIELGFGAIGKQTDNGKIGYNTFGEANTLSIVGGGILASGFDRKIKMWADAGTNFTGGASFAKSVGIGVLNPNYKLHLFEPIAGTGVNFQITNADAGNTVNDGLHIGLNPNGLLFQLAASIMNKENSSLFIGTNNLVNLTLNAAGNVGMGTYDPKVRLHVSGPNDTKLFSVRNTDTESDNRDLFGVSPEGVNIITSGTGASGGILARPGKVLVNTNKETQLGKWGFDNTGAEMISGNQNINFATETKLNFTGTSFLHHNYDLGPAFDLSLAEETADRFNVAVDGVYLVDFQVIWINNEIRNGKIMVKVNGVTRREFGTNQYARDHCFIKCNANDYITIEVYHETCSDPPPFCINGTNRLMHSSRVTVMKF